MSGNYTQSLTIASDNDIIINGSITTPVDGSGVPTRNALLGLVANDFVRVYHPVVGTRGNTQSDCNGSGQTQRDQRHHAVAQQPEDLRRDPRRQPLVHRRQLRLRRRIAGARHAVRLRRDRAALPRAGRHGRQRRRQLDGYLKNYNYNDTLASEEPPYFLNPVSAQWYVPRETECDSASTC